MRRLYLLATFALCAVSGALIWYGAQPRPYDVKKHYQKFEYMVPMRDGVSLYTAVYVLRNSPGKLPIMLRRTPYRSNPYGPEAYPWRLGAMESSSFEEDGFIFVNQDIRGKFMSEGEFTLMAPYKPRKTLNETDECTDTHDTIEWLLQNVPGHNDRVGMWGMSYPGFEVMKALIEPPPALKAASPQASPADMFIGDAFHTATVRSTWPGAMPGC